MDPSSTRHRLPNPALCIPVWLVLVALPALAASPATEWSRFRGPDGNGISQDASAPVKWSDTDFLWKVELPGKGHSSPVVWQDQVFVTSGDDQTGTRYISCFNRRDGSRLWEKKIPSRTYQQNRDNSLASSTPAVNESGLYTYWTTPESVQVIALSLGGKEKWTQDLGPFTGRHGSGASCVVLDQVVWVNNDQDGPSALLGLAAETGSIKYRLNRRADRVSYGTPCVLNREDGKSELIFAASSHGLTSINPQTGTINWEATNVFPTRVVSSPITSGGLVICSCGEGGVGRRLVAVRPPAAKGQPALVYDLKSNVPNVPTPLAIDGLLYLLCDNGMLRCVRSATGEPVWQEKLTERFYSSPVYAGGRLYLTGKTGVVLVIAAGEKYQLLAQNSLGAASFATPAIAGSTIFFRTVSHLIAVGGKP